MIDFNIDRGLNLPKEISNKLGNRTNLLTWTNLYFHCRYLAKIGNGKFFLSRYKTAKANESGNKKESVNIRVFLLKMQKIGIIQLVKKGTPRKTANEYVWIRTDLLPFESTNEKKLI
jgi:hypothetical protein